MKKWQICFSILSMLVLVTFLLPAAPIPSIAQEKPIELKLAHMFPVGSPSHIHMEAWADKIASGSNGKLTIRIFPVNTLVPAPELVDAAAKGTADITFGFRYGPKNNPIGVTFPFILGAPDTMTASQVFDDIWEEFPKEMAAEWDNVHVLWLVPSMIQFISTSKPVRKLDDMKGLQIRVPSKEMGDLMKDLGAAPAFMSTADFVIAIEKGTVDGAVIQPGAVHDNKLGGKVKYVLNFGLGIPTPVFCIMNKDVYADLPADLKQVIDNSCEWGKQGTLKFWSEAYDNAMKYFNETGVEVVNLPPAEKERMAPIVENARDRVGKDLDGKGLPGSQVVRFIRERVKHYAP
ncbi:MAG: TRAP transporter substrate-binding protein DctP [Deltaproteobacteria bacterium]|nr:TRAP transporter substrate-binding protein DctP [Deltaproteobacteria bacterium]